MFLLSVFIQNKQDFKQLIEGVGKFFILFSLIIAMLGLWKFFYAPAFFSYTYSNGMMQFKWGSTLVSDYNFFALFLFTGLIFGFYKILDSPTKIKHKIVFLTILQVIIFSALLSGSRRLYIIMGIFFVGCIVLLIPFLYRKIFSNSVTYKYFLLFFLLFILNLGFFYSFLRFPYVSEKVEKILFLDSKFVNTNIQSISIRINSAASVPLIDNENATDVVPITTSRKDLWALGKKTYQEYSAPQKIFGRGFTFLDVFQQETGKYYYPHQLFLSILLFSGIFGLIIYIAVLFWCSYIYLLYLKDLFALFFLFFVNFTFGFFSFTDFFGASFYALLIILPIHYRYLYKNEKNNTIAALSE
jgi:hypothetical protein